MKLATFFVLFIGFSINSFAAQAPPQKTALTRARRHASEAIIRKKVKLSFEKISTHAEIQAQAGLMILAARNTPAKLKKLIYENKFPLLFSNQSVLYQPIFAAFHSGNRESITILLDAGINLDQKYRGVLRREINKLFTLKEFLEGKHLPSEVNLNLARQLFAEYSKPRSSERKPPIILD